MLPRPSVAITSPFPGFELRCQAVTTSELGTSAELIAASVIDGKGTRLLNRSSIGKLSPREFDLLWMSVRAALTTAFPSLGLTDLAAWRPVLSQGANDPSNLVLTHALGGCVDFGFGGISERPDRFFGVPLNQLVDAHWLAFWAAREAFTKEHPPPQPPGRK
jgi:hypothetical protein